jgi:Protein of unknown function (DUF4232)
MKHHTTSMRRLVAAAAAAVAGLAISTAAYAATSSPAARTATTIPQCTGGLGLGAWVAVSQGNGAAGTVFYPLEFTNTSGHTCSLFGYPGVSAISRTGQQLGSPAGWGSLSGARRVVLAPGATAHTILAYHDVMAYPERVCDPVDTTVELRIYPPDQRQATYAAFDFEACSRAGVVYMGIDEPIRAGVGTING